MKKLLIIALFFQVGTACSPPIVTQQRQPVAGTAVPATILEPKSEVQGGGVTAGGGSTVERKPLEAYAKKMATTPLYRNQLLPLIENLKEHYPRLAADFLHMIHRRAWYFVPMSLDEISKTILGTYGRTEQAALQDLNQVWFDSRIFDEMTDKDRMILVLHELVMGTHLLNYKSRQDQCFAKAAVQLLGNENGSEAYDQALRHCRRTYSIGEDLGSRKFNLTSEDYNNIRNLVIELIQDKPNWKEIVELSEETIRKHTD